MTVLYLLEKAKNTFEDNTRHFRDNAQCITAFINPLVL